MHTNDLKILYVLPALLFFGAIMHLMTEEDMEDFADFIFEDQAYRLIMASTSFWIVAGWLLFI